MVSLTIFDSIYDNKTDKRMDYNSFDEFEAILYKLSESTKYPTKKDAPLLSPAIYQTGTTRANDNVVGWAGFGIVVEVKRTVGGCWDQSLEVLLEPVEQECLLKSSGNSVVWLDVDVIPTQVRTS